MNRFARQPALFGAALAVLLAACSGDAVPPVGFGGTGGGGTGGSGAGGDGGGPPGGGTGPGLGGGLVDDCEPTTCAALGWECGYLIDACGNVVDCTAEGLTCDAGEVCSGGIDEPTECLASSGVICEVCESIPDCSGQPGVTRIEGRVLTPGRDDADAANQVGVPNAIVYVLQTNSVDDLPALETGIPQQGARCDRCEDRELGPVLTGAVTDAEGRYALEERLPVGVEMLLVVQAGKFRRASRLTLPAEAACQTTSFAEGLPDNPTRLPRASDDGLAAHLPAVAVSTGQIDAMECVFSKLGIAASEFGNPGNAARIHLYRGASAQSPAGARIDDDTPHDDALYSDLDELGAYDMVVADCEGQTWDDDFAQRDASGANLRSYVNRGGRLFASHLSFSWLHENGNQAYSPDAAEQTGLGGAATWATNINTQDTGTGVVSVGRPDASPRVDNFAAWMQSEGIASAPLYEFSIVEPRSQATALGPSSEVFVHLGDGNERIQQFSFNTPYGAPESAACGRVAYSGFHVSVGGGLTPFEDAVFPEHCTGPLTDQEKVLLYMLFDLGACVGEELPPSCTPVTCAEVGAACGPAPDGCGGLLDCGACRPPE